MEFRISAQTPQQLVLRATSAFRLISILFMALAIPALPLGVLLIITDPAQSAGHAAAGLGLFFWGASRLSARAGKIQPAQLIFDNAVGQLRILQRIRSKDTEQAAIAYRRIARFCTVARHDDGATKWCTAMELNDATLLTLHAHASQEKARAETQLLEQSVQLSHSAPEIAAALPRSVQQIKHNGYTTFVWQFGFLSAQNLAGLAAVAGFLWAMFSFVPADDRFGKIAVSGFTAVLASVVVWFGMRWAGAHGELEIGANEVRYFETRGFRKRLRHAMPLAELDRVLFAAGAAGDSAIWFLKQGEYGELRKIDLGETGLADVAGALQFMRRVFKIYTPMLNFSERLRFAEMIKSNLSLPRI